MGCGEEGVIGADWRAGRLLGVDQFEGIDSIAYCEHVSMFYLFIYQLTR